MTDWHKKATEIKNNLQPVQLFINGVFQNSTNNEFFNLTSPIDGTILTQAALAQEEDVNLAVTAARNNFNAGTWANLAPSARKNILLKWADVLEQHAEELALLETLEVGKPIYYSYNGDIKASINCLRWNAEAIDKIYGEVAPTGKNDLVTITRDPLGVVAVVVPWNFPLLMAMWKIAPALAMGNSVILKPSENSSLSARKLAELSLQVGLPAGTFNLVTGTGETVGKTLGLHNNIDGVFFTGSTRVGKYFMQYAGQSNLKKISLECGGKSGNIILNSCKDLKKAAYTSADAIFFNQGEMCSAGSKLIVQKESLPEVLKHLTEKAKEYTPKDPLDINSRMGAIINETQHNKILHYIELGKQEGADLILGGQKLNQDGYWIEPTIFTNVKSNMKIAQDEIFGPVLSIITVNDKDEAIEVANDSIYGLAAAVWSDDVNELFYVAYRLRAGSIYMNCYDSDFDMSVPFGGYKQSGIGRDKSLHALEKYSEITARWLKLDRA